MTNPQPTGRSHRTAALWICTALAALATTAGCETNTMDRDLKRQADRATILLNQAENERDAAKAELETVTAALKAEQLRTKAADEKAAQLAEALRRSESDRMAGLKRIRELDEAALAHRQGMPTTRAVGP